MSDHYQRLRAVSAAVFPDGNFSRITVGVDAKALLHATRHLSDDHLNVMRMVLTSTD